MPREVYRASLRKVWRSAGYVVVLGLLVPSLLDNLIAWADLRPASRVAFILAAIALVLLVALAVETTRHRRPGPLQINALSAARYSEVTSVVAAQSVGNSHPVTHTLLERLPNLEHLALVCSEDTRGGDEVSRVAQWAGDIRPQCEVTMMHCRPSAYELQLEVVDALTSELKLMARTQPGLIVDITGGTKVITLTLNAAAKAAGLPVIYVAQNASRDFAGAIVLADPSGRFAPEGEL